MNQLPPTTSIKSNRWCIGLVMTLLLAGCNNAETDQIQSSDKQQGLNKIVVNPVNQTIPPGLSRQFEVLGIDNNGSSAKITQGINWSSTAPAVATVTADGQVSTISSGTATIEASVAGLTGRTMLTVPDARLVSMTLSPQQSTAIVGEDVQFSASGSYSNGSNEDLTSVVLWTSSDVAISRFNPDRLPNSGLVSAIAPGTSTLVATMSNLKASTTFTVTEANLTGLYSASSNTTDSGTSLNSPATNLELADIHFEFDKFRLTEAAEAKLRDYLAQLNTNPTAKIQIAGHTSKSGSESYNQRLSEQRADAVKAFWVLEGITNPGRITTQGFGEHQNAEIEADPTVLRSAAAKANMRASFDITFD